MARTTGSNSYTWAEFLRNITPAMYGDIMELALSTASTTIARHARYTVAIWQAEGKVDFRDPQTVAAVTWLVSNTDSWTPQNAQELAG